MMHHSLSGSQVSSPNSPRPSKRRKVEKTINPFVSLEAAESEHEDEDEDVDEEENEDFIEFEPMVADNESCLAHLHVEYEQAQEDEAWKDFLERAQTRAASHPSQVEPDTAGPILKHGVKGVRPGEGDTLFMVPVLRGWETTYTFRIMKHIFSAAPSTVSAIRSVIGRASYPGAIFIEATSVEAVYQACAGFTYAKLEDIRKMPAADAHQCLEERKTFVPRNPGWVRLTKGHYRGDTAYVKDVSRSLDTTLLIIPRIPRDDAKKRKPLCRPPQLLFDANAISSRFKVVQLNQTFLFKGEYYRDGFLLKETEGSGFDQRDTLPSPDELKIFELLPEIPRAFIQSTYDAINSSSLRSRDRVLITCGSLQGQSGVIESVLPNSARVQIAGLDLCTDVGLNELRKDIQVGDGVRVIAGANAGFTGWVVSVEGTSTVSVVDDKLHKEVKEHTGNVEFGSPDRVVALVNSFDNGKKVQVVSGPKCGIVGKVISTGDAGDVAITVDDNSGLIMVQAKDLLAVDDDVPCGIGAHLAPDPNRIFIGRQIMSLTKGHRHYRGIIRDILNDGLALVELEATLSRTRIKLQDLAISIDGRYTPLRKLSVQHPTQIRSAGAPLEFPVPVPSTPLPSPWSQPVSPAWDPSSRTPFPPFSSSQPLTPAMPPPPGMFKPVVPLPVPLPQTQNPPWFSSSKLPTERLKVRIVGTKPDFGDPGWKYGDYEGRCGHLTSADDESATVQLGIIDAPRVPAKYIIPLRPTLPQEVVVVLSGPMEGQEFNVNKIDNMECKLKPRNARGRKIEWTFLRVDTLCVVKP